MSIGQSVVYLDQSGALASCDPRPSKGDAGQRCDPHKTRTVVMLTAGPGLLAVSVRYRHSAHRVVAPRHANVFLDVARGALAPPSLRLTFRGGCNARHRKQLLKFHDARRVGCRVVIPLPRGR